MTASERWSDIERRITRCRLCPRLVAHREEVAATRRRQFASEEYWGRPVPGFGDPRARLLVVGLAPAAHGANRTGRMFTGDRSGEWLYRSLHACGFASQPHSVDRHDGLALRDAFITAVARCAPPANKPTPDEIAACRTHLVAELGALDRLRVVVVLGQIALDGFLRARAEMGHAVPRPRPRFGHGREHVLDPNLTLLTSYHPSQQNTFTGKLTREMLDAVFQRAARIIGESENRRSGRRAAAPS